ncbi:MAG: hypothetical protein ACYC6A_24805, partial [Armatimonadota bacterium]
TGVGVYINYTIPNSVDALSIKAQFCFSDIDGALSPLLHDIGFLLWVDEGYLTCLEIYTYDEPWPDVIDSFKITYIVGKRDMIELREAWSKYLH